MQRVRSEAGCGMNMLIEFNSHFCVDHETRRLIAGNDAGIAFWSSVVGSADPPVEASVDADGTINYPDGSTLKWMSHAARDGRRGIYRASVNLVDPKAVELEVVDPITYHVDLTPARLRWLLQTDAGYAYLMESAGIQVDGECTTERVTVEIERTIEVFPDGSKALVVPATPRTYSIISSA